MYNIIKNIFDYSYATYSAISKKSNLTTLWYALRYAYPCLKSCNNPKYNSIADAQPWITFPAIKALKRILTKNSNVFEYGSGGSTLFFASRVERIVSIEHHREWYVTVTKELANRKIENVEYKLIEPIFSEQYDRSQIADPLAYISDDENSIGMIYDDYAKSIMQYPDNYFDLVVVDGRARPSCMFHALTKIKKNGVLLLDQSERSYYLEKMRDFLKPHEWLEISYMAPLPYNLHFTETTFFIKRV